MQTSPEALALFPALVALLETESVTEAAARLGVGQPAMSRTLARLRELFGDPLLVRVGRRVQRTRRADELLPQALETLALASRTLTRPERFDPRTAEGVLTFALGDDLSAMLLGPLLLSLRREAPGSTCACGPSAAARSTKRGGASSISRSRPISGRRAACPTSRTS